MIMQTTLLDAADNKPIADVTAYADGKAIGKTDAAGMITLPTAGQYKFTHVSYQTETFPMSELTEQTYLTKSFGDLPAVVITAIKKKESIFVIVLIILAIVLYYSYKKGLLK